MLEFEGIAFSWNGLPALSGIDAEIGAGTITAVIGPNGSGKSTLLGCAAGLLRPHTGTVRIGGVPVCDRSEAELALIRSVLTQSNTPTMRYTVAELVEFGRYPHCGRRFAPADRDAVEHAIEFADLSDIRGRYITELSGGQVQRAFIAMVIAQDTPVIFLDEPLNNLDIRHAIETMELLVRLCREEGKTIFMVLHDIPIAAAYADEVLALKDGAVHYHGAGAEFFTPESVAELFDLGAVRLPYASIGGALSRARFSEVPSQPLPVR